MEPLLYENLALVTLAVFYLLTTGFLTKALLNQQKRIQSLSQHLDTTLIEDIGDAVDQLSEDTVSITEKIQHILKSREIEQAKIAKLESQFAELHEFVNRGIKRMSTRAQRAELLDEVMRQSKELDTEQDDELPGQLKMEFDGYPEDRPKLIPGG